MGTWSSKWKNPEFKSPYCPPPKKLKEAPEIDGEWVHMKKWETQLNFTRAIKLQMFLTLFICNRVSLCSSAWPQTSDLSISAS
jgi:hypothetical protein